MNPHEHPAAHADRITRDSRTLPERLDDHRAWLAERIDDWRQRTLDLEERV